MGSQYTTILEQVVSGYLAQLILTSAYYCRNTHSSPAAHRLTELSNAQLHFKHYNSVQLFENKQSVLTIKHYLGYIFDIFDTSGNQSSGLVKTDILLLSCVQQVANKWITQTKP